MGAFMQRCPFTHSILAAYNIIILFCIVHIHIIYIVYM